MNFVAVELYKCGNCGLHNHTVESAEDCCLCCYCKKPKGHQYVNSDCEKCRDEKRHENFIKNLQVLPFDPNEIYCIGDDFFFDGYESILEHLAESEYESIDEWPEYAHFTKFDAFSIDPESVLENFTSDHHEDIYDSLVDVKELEDFIKKWSEKQTAKTYWEDSKRAIRIDSIPGYAEAREEFIKQLED